MSTITFSIIIPHKNIPVLLQRCLDSIPCRDDLEIIIVDDCSNSEIVNSVGFPGLKKANTKVFFDRTGKGAGRARNIGLNNAIGEWVIFADADDVFEPDFTEILDLLSKDEKSDVVNFDVTSRNSETGEINNEIEKVHYHCTDQKYIKNPMAFKYIVLVPWGKAIRRSFLTSQNILFEEVRYGNDLRFASLCDFYCKQRRIIPLVGYCWMYRDNSLWRQKNLEWAEIRFYVLLKNGRLMYNLKEFQYSKRLTEGALGFLPEIKKHSYYKYIKALYAYGLYTQNLRYLVITIPHIVLNDIKRHVTKP